MHFYIDIDMDGKLTEKDKARAPNAAHTASSVQGAEASMVSENKGKLSGIPKEILDRIQEMESIEVGENKFLQEYKDIRDTSAFGQLPEVGRIALNKALIENRKRVEVWHSIRNFIVDRKHYKSLWQLAIEKERFVVKRLAKEEVLSFGSKEIRNLLKVGVWYGQDNHQARYLRLPIMQGQARSEEKVKNIDKR